MVHNINSAVSRYNFIMSDDRLPLIKRYLERLAKYKMAAGGMIFCMTVAAFLEPTLAFMLKPLLDGQDSKFIIEPQYLHYVMALILLLLAMAGYGRAYLGGWLNETMQRDLRRDMAMQLVRIPLEKFGDESAGKTTTRFMGFVPSLTSPTMPVFTALVQEPLKTIFYLGQMLYLQWQLALIVCAAMPITAWLIRGLAKRMKKVATKAQNEVANSQTRLNESIALMPVIKIQGATAAATRIGYAFSRLRNAAMRVMVVVAAGQPLSQLVISVPTVIVVFYVVRALEAETMTAGDVAAFLGCMLLMPRSIRAIARSATLLEGMLPAAREVFGFLESEKEEDKGNQKISRARGEIVFQDVHLNYPNAVNPALDGLSVTIAAGETVALVGRSGAGKTSLANLLPRFYTPQKGKVLLDGIDIRELTLESLRAQFAIVTQEPLLFDDTVAENVCYPDIANDENQARILQALKEAAADDFVADLPHGIQTRIGENGRRLSGGQKQRLALARAFYRDAPIIILDEATSALDSEAESKIKTAMQKLLSGRTAIIIAHRFAAIDFAERVLVLDKGRLIDSGSSQELLQSCSLYAELYRAQQLQ